MDEARTIKHSAGLFKAKESPLSQPPGTRGFCLAIFLSSISGIPKPETGIPPPKAAHAGFILFT
jgi:hypothetical protein